MEIPIERLLFDPQNPRLPRSIDRHSRSSVLEWMLTDATLIELMGSIGEQGYFPGEPILVVPSQPGKDDPATDSFTVVEGNRRLAAVILLLDPKSAPARRSAVADVAGAAPHSPDRLPALVFERRAATLDYLGFRHVTGIKEWTPLAKARFLKELFDEHRDARPRPKVLRELALTIGSRSDYVARLLTTLAVFDYVVEAEFFDLVGVDEESIEFSLLSTALSYRAIAQFVGLETSRDPAVTHLKHRNLRDLVDWTFCEREGGRIVGESRQLRELAAVVESSRALKLLRRGGSLDTAVLLTDEPSRTFRKTIRLAKDKLEIALNQIHLIEDLAQEDVDLLSDLQRLVRDLSRLAKDRVDEADE